MSPSWMESWVFVWLCYEVCDCSGSGFAGHRKRSSEVSVWSAVAKSVINCGVQEELVASRESVPALKTCGIAVQ